MTGRDRVRLALARKRPDRTPRNFTATPTMANRLIKYSGCEDYEALLRRYDIDFRYVSPEFTGRALKNYIDSDGLRVEEVYWGYAQKYYPTGNGAEYPINVDFPWNKCETAKEIREADFVSPDDFNYDSLRRQADAHPDKALVIAGAGAYQFATFMREATLIYMDMAADPELASAVFDRFAQFELEYYERAFQALDGRLDILTVFDDYGAQNGLLFSREMWRTFFMENTRRLAELAHKHGAIFIEHSCGAVRNIIPEIIACGADALDPIQKCPGMELEGLKRDFGDKIAFHGGVDTQWLLPNAKPAEVAREAARLASLFPDGGYVLAPSQCFQDDTPCQNVDAMYFI